MDENWEDNFNADLFLNEEYIQETLRLEGLLEQPLYLSSAASTDWDLTGQVLWPVSIFLSYYIAKRRELFDGRSVAEFGAGCGLAGLVASHFASRTCLTDGEEVVVRLLQRNAELQREGKALQRGAAGQAVIDVMMLRWGSKSDLEKFVEKFGVPDVLVGADIVCWPQYVQPLVRSVKRLMQLKQAQADSAEPLTLYLGYVCRALNNHQLFLRACDEAGLNIEEISAESFLPSPVPEHVRSSNQLQLLVVTPDLASQKFAEAVEFEEGVDSDT